MFIYKGVNHVRLLNNILKIIREVMSKMSSPSSSEIEEKRVTSIFNEADFSTQQEVTKVHTNSFLLCNIYILFMKNYICIIGFLF
jgi:Ethanolamine utilization protein EutJ (predicted chaperonin)